MNLLGLSTLVHGKKSAIIFLQERGILHEQRRCSNGHLMTLSFTSDRWRCNIRGCRKEIGIRKDTWLQDSKLDLSKIVLLICCWTKKLTTIDFCDEELEFHLTSLSTGKISCGKCALEVYCKLPL